MAKSRYRIVLEQLRVTCSNYTIQAVLMSDTPLTREQVISQVIKWGYVTDGKSPMDKLVTANLHSLAKAGYITRTDVGENDHVYGWPVDTAEARDD